MKDIFLKIRTAIKHLHGLWKIYSIRRFEYLWKGYNILRSTPRRCLEYRILPFIFAADELQNILIVGVTGCARHYFEYFNGKASVHSIDINPQKAVSGNPGRHIIDSVENIGKYFKPGSLDCVLMNGVYGWGLNSGEALETALEAIFGSLRKGGLLVFGFDKVPKYDPIDIDSKPYFRKFAPYRIFGRSRIELDEKNRHIYTFFTRP